MHSPASAPGVSPRSNGGLRPRRPQVDTHTEVGVPLFKKIYARTASSRGLAPHKQIPKVSSTNPSLSDSDRLGWYLIPLVFWRRSKLEQGYQRGAKNRAVAHRQTSTARGERGPNEHCAQKPFLKKGNAFRPLNDDAAYDVVWADTTLRRIRRGTSSVHQ